VREDNTRTKHFKCKMLCRLWVGRKEERSRKCKTKHMSEVATAVTFSFNMGHYLGEKMVSGKTC